MINTCLIFIHKYLSTSWFVFLFVLIFATTYSRWAWRSIPRTKNICRLITLIWLILIFVGYCYNTKTISINVINGDDAISNVDIYIHETGKNYKTNENGIAILDVHSKYENINIDLSKKGYAKTNQTVKTNCNINKINLKSNIEVKFDNLNNFLNCKATTEKLNYSTAVIFSDSEGKPFELDTSKLRMTIDDSVIKFKQNAIKTDRVNFNTVLTGIKDNKRTRLLKIHYDNALISSTKLYIVTTYKFPGDEHLLGSYTASSARGLLFKSQDKKPIWIDGINKTSVPFTILFDYEVVDPRSSFSINFDEKSRILIGEGELKNIKFMYNDSKLFSSPLESKINVNMPITARLIYSQTTQLSDPTVIIDVIYYDDFNKRIKNRFPIKDTGCLRLSQNAKIGFASVLNVNSPEDSMVISKITIVNDIFEHETQAGNAVGFDEHIPQQASQAR